MTAARPSARSLRAASAILRHSRTIIVVWVAITAALGLAAAGVRIDPEVVRLLPRDDAAQRLMETYGEEDKDLNYLIVMLRADQPFAVSSLQALAEADRAIAAEPLVVSSVTPLNLPAFRLDGGGCSSHRPSRTTRACLPGGGGAGADGAPRRPGGAQPGAGRRRDRPGAGVRGHGDPRLPGVPGLDRAGARQAARALPGNPGRLDTAAPGHARRARPRPLRSWGCLPRAWSS